MFRLSPTTDNCNWFQESVRAAEVNPSGAKAQYSCGLGGTAEAVPFPKGTFETSFNNYFFKVRLCEKYLP
jgi:hypothetical protein